MELLETVARLCTADGDCLLYKGRKNQQGFGIIEVKKKWVLVHRVVWRIHHGAPRKGWLIEHICGNSLCCSISHMVRETVVRRIERMCVLEGDCLLYTGGIHKTLGYGVTAMDCSQIATHRAVWSAYNGEICKEIRVGHTCGRRHCCNVLHMYAARRAITKELAQRIKNTLGYGTKGDRAKLFKVSLSVVSRIDAGKTWAHLPCVAEPAFENCHSADAMIFADNVFECNIE